MKGFVAFLMIVLLAGCGEVQRQAEPTPPPAASPSPLSVQVAVATRRSVPQDLKLVGTFKAAHTVKMAPRVDGAVTAVTVTAGDRVRRGQVLLRLDEADAILQIREDEALLAQALSKVGLTSPDQRLRDRYRLPAVRKAQADLDDAKSTWVRDVALRKELLISQKQVDDDRKALIQARANLEESLQTVQQDLDSVQKARIVLEQDRLKLGLRTLRSPLDGMVEKVSVAAGDSVQAGNEAFTLVSERPLYLDVEVPQRYVERLASGERLTIVSDAAPGQRFSGHVLRVSPEVSTQTRTLTVRARVDDPSSALLPGAFGKVVLRTGVQHSLVVPQAALLDEMGQSRVFVVPGKDAEGTVKAFRVTRGATDGREVEIVGDVQVGDRVVVGRLAEMRDGVAVRVRH